MLHDTSEKIWAAAATFACLWAAPAAAENPDIVPVSLSVKSSAIVLNGTLVGATGDTVTIDTHIGAVTLNQADVVCDGAACPVTRVPATARDVAAETSTVDLSSEDGSLTIAGSLRAVSDTHFYVNFAAGGVVRVVRDAVACAGVGCQTADPDIVAQNRVIQLLGPTYLVNDVVPKLVSAHLEKVSAPEIAQRHSDRTFSFDFAQDATTLFAGGTQTPAAFHALATGAADVVIAGRQPTERETAAMMAAGWQDPRGGTSEQVIAGDALRVVTHPSLDIPGLSLADLAGIYDGRITNWSDLGGPDALIMPIARAPGSDEAEIFASAVFDTPPKTRAEATLFAASPRDVTALLAQNPHAIAYVWHGYGERMRDVAVTGSCGLILKTDAFARWSQDTPFAGNLYLYASTAAQAEIEPVLATFADSPRAWSRSTMGASAVAARPLAADLLPAGWEQDLIGDRAEYARALAANIPHWTRHPTTFRLVADEGEFGALSQRKLDQIAQLLAQSPGISDIAVIGFSHGLDGFAASVAQSVNDATRVTEALKARGMDALADLNVLTAGFGDIAPLACDADPKGSHINRRVEIWLRQS